MVSEIRRARKAILGKKVGMTRVFTEDGKHVPVTVIQVGPCTVLQVKTKEKDGYDAVQLGFDDARKPRKKPQQAHLDKLGVAAKRFVREVPYVDPADVVRAGSGSSEGAGSSEAGSSEAGSSEGGDTAVAPGDQIGVVAFKDVKNVDIRGVTKGRGFAGTIKRHGFSTGDKSHGSKNTRDPGSTGMHTDPGRVFKGKKMAGHYGNANCKTMNLSVVEIDEEDHLLVVKGAVPGPNGGYLYIEEGLRVS